MQFTFISTERIVITVLLFTLAFVIYLWKVRPYLSRTDTFREIYKDADTRWQAVWEWVKVRWSIVSAAMVAALPIIWNGGLDAAVAVSRIASDGTLDLSWLVMPPWIKTTIQIVAIVLPIIQAARVKPKNSD